MAREFRKQSDDGRELRCAVMSVTWTTNDAQPGGDLEKPAALRLVDFSEESHCLSTNSCSTPDVDLEHLARVLLVDAFYLPVDHLSCIVEHDVYTAKCFLSFGERCGNLSVLGDIQSDDKKLSGWVLGSEVS